MSPKPTNGDKNLQNVVGKLELEGVTAHHSQQINQDIQDRRKEAKATNSPRTPGNP